MVHARLSPFRERVGFKPSNPHHDAICQALGNEDCRAFFDIMTLRHVVRGQMIFNKTSQENTLAIVLSGLVKLTALLADGRQQIVGLFFESDLIWQRFRSDPGFLAEAACDVDVCLLCGEQFAAALRSHPVQVHAIFEKALDDLGQAQAQLLNLGRKTATEKVASLLVKLQHGADLSRCPPKPSGSNLPRILLAMTRADMADYLGLTVETVSRCLTKFKSADLIRLLDARTIELCDPDHLQAIAECRNN